MDYPFLSLQITSQLFVDSLAGFLRSHHCWILEEQDCWALDFHLWSHLSLQHGRQPQQNDKYISKNISWWHPGRIRRIDSSNWQLVCGSGPVPSQLGRGHRFKDLFEVSDTSRDALKEGMLVSIKAILTQRLIKKKKPTELYKSWQRQQLLCSTGQIYI